MTRKKRFRRIIEKVINEHGDSAPWLKANVEPILAEFDGREDTGTFHGIYQFLAEITGRAEKHEDFFTGEEFYEIEFLQMARQTHTAQRVELKLFLDGTEIDPGRTSLGGEPSWEQNRDHPVCPLCDRNMTLVFQLDSLAQLSQNENLQHLISQEDYAFGDVGIIRFFRCVKCNKFDANWECG